MLGQAVTQCVLIKLFSTSIWISHRVTVSQSDSIKNVTSNGPPNNIILLQYVQFQKMTTNIYRLAQARHRGVMLDNPSP